MFITDQVKEHGYEKGVREFFSERRMTYQQLMALSKAPENCPWYEHRSLPPDEVVLAVFEPLQEKMPELVNMLQENCMAVLCMQAEGIWYLLYVMEMWGTDHYLWIGREPADTPSLAPEAVEAGWTLPASLQEFYQVHHGFGESDLVYDDVFDHRLWGASCIKPARRLEPLTWETEGEDENPYHPGDILFFFHDGGGDFYGILKDNGKVAYFNHEENYVEDSLAGDFFKQMDEFFSEMFL